MVGLALALGKGSTSVGRGAGREEEGRQSGGVEGSGVGEAGGGVEGSGRVFRTLDRRFPGGASAGPQKGHRRHWVWGGASATALPFVPMMTTPTSRADHTLPGARLGAGPPFGVYPVAIAITGTGLREVGYHTPATLLCSTASYNIAVLLCVEHRLVNIRKECKSVA